MQKINIWRCGAANPLALRLFDGNNIIAARLIDQQAANIANHRERQLFLSLDMTAII
jgi:hypothetical protein